MANLAVTSNIEFVILLIVNQFLAVIYVYL